MLSPLHVMTETLTPLICREALYQILYDEARS
jgi:hypothetical protein